MLSLQILDQTRRTKIPEQKLLLKRAPLTSNDSLQLFQAVVWPLSTVSELHSSITRVQDAFPPHQTRTESFAKRFRPQAPLHLASRAAVCLLLGSLMLSL